MSLFPAYGLDNDDQTTKVVSKSSELAWLTNQSFIPFAVNDDEGTSGAQEPIGEDNLAEPLHRPSKYTEEKAKKRKGKHKKKHKRKHSKRSSSSSSSSSASTALCAERICIAEADYYTDVDPLKIYLSVEKLHRPACPRYRLGTKKPLGASNDRSVPNERYKRYYRVHRNAHKREEAKETQQEVNDREEAMERSLRTEETADKWIELIHFRQSHPLPNLDSYQNHKRELTLIERARRRLPADETLLNLYLNAIVRVHPTDEVLELVRKAITKDETNITLWRAFIGNKQCSMAQCIVPDVLKLYEKSTRALFMARRSDETMLQLFKNCATFCRQAGLCELMFGIVQLTLSMNVSERFGAGSGLFGSPEHFQQLIEYEELILKSGLPMNEIWLRIEMLRSAFHYLPFAGGQQLLSDPQRIVLNDDVVGFVYPLINKIYAFELTLTVLRLMKFPFRSVHFEALECFHVEPYEVDYPEQLLPLFLDVTRNRLFDSNIHALIKTLSVSPTFVSTNLAHEAYLEMVRTFLTLAIDHFKGEQSAILLVLYLQFERTLVCWEKASGGHQLSEANLKMIRGRVKNILKHTHASNQNNLLVYTEYGLLEYEMTGSLEGQCRKIFNTSVQVHGSNAEQRDQPDTEQENELYSLVLAMVEVLLCNGHTLEAIRALTYVTLKPIELSFQSEKSQNEMTVPDTMKLSALQRLNDRVNVAMRNETDINTHDVTIEQYFHPSALINAIKAYVFYLTLTRSEGFAEAAKQLETFLFLLNEPANARHRFLREQIYGIYLQLFEISRGPHGEHQGRSRVNMKQFLDVIDRALQEFPANLYTLRSVVFNESVPWFRLRNALSKHLSPQAVLLMVMAAHHRGTHVNVDHNSQKDCTPYKHRILNLLSGAVKSTVASLHQNALLWRLYLRELFDQPNAPPGYSVLEQCRKTLYAALEACPWNKALYLDGASFAPQELSQLLDLMMEKQLRVHAIPEELAILRDE
ncbi:uncharacterized protein LOC131205666 [Anopheles bellator]|uniref:uncharacterized protein LOC131205666 n=1 Tax=Anopheles bellator TaxID=139047 RepID=UPI00264890E7|nr:uncharacterized protein LOC131205666 [Anopheles bellator]